MTDLSKADTTIYIGNFAIHQPVTAFTGLIIATICLFFYTQLKRINVTNKSSYNWGLFFLYILLATLTGSCSHAFYAVHEGAGYKTFWLTSQLFNVIAVYAAQQATFNSVLQFSENKRGWQRVSGLQLLLFIPSIFVFQNFLVVVIDYALGLIPVMLVHFADGKKEKTSLWIAYGILISFITAFIHVFKIAFNKYFNHLDIAHVLIMVNLSIMYIGIKQKAIASISV